MGKYSEKRIDGLADFRRKFVDGEDVTEIEVTRAEDQKNSTYVVIRYGQWTAVINPMPMNGYLDLDVHAFSGDESHKARVFGMPYGNRVELPDGHNYPMTVVIIGEDSE